MLFEKLIITLMRNTRKDLQIMSNKAGLRYIDICGFRFTESASMDSINIVAANFYLTTASWEDIAVILKGVMRI